MALAKEHRTEIINKFKKSENDTGSPEVQIALLSSRVSQLSEHFKIHKKDNHSRRSLIAIVNRRRRLLDYVKKKKFDRYKDIIKELGIRK